MDIVILCEYYNYSQYYRNTIVVIFMNRQLLLLTSKNSATHNADHSLLHQPQSLRIPTGALGVYASVSRPSPSCQGLGGASKIVRCRCLKKAYEGNPEVCPPKNGAKYFVHYIKFCSTLEWAH